MRGVQYTKSSLTIASQKQLRAVPSLHVIGNRFGVVSARIQERTEVNEHKGLLNEPQAHAHHSGSRSRN